MVDQTPKTFPDLSSEKPDYLPASGEMDLLENAPQIQCEWGKVTTSLFFFFWCNKVLLKYKGDRESF